MRATILLGMCALLLAMDAGAANLLDLSASLRERGVTLTREPVYFDHDGHNMDAGIMDCRTCHHDYAFEDGQLVQVGDSIGLPCATCHGATQGAGAVAQAARRAADTADAMHMRCGGCHAAGGRGPVACVGCHRG